MSQRKAFRLGVAGPVGAGKTSLVEQLSRTLLGKRTVAAVINEVYTREDADYLLTHKTLPRERIKSIVAAQHPRDAIVAMNLAAVEELQAATRRLDLVLIEAVGDYNAASFSPEIADAWIYIIDVANGDKIPRKGNPGIPRSDMLIVNKIDLAAMVNVSLRNMERDCRLLRGERPMVFTNLRCGHGIAHAIDWLESIIGQSAESANVAGATTMQYAL